MQVPLVELPPSTWVANEAYTPGQLQRFAKQGNSLHLQKLASPALWSHKNSGPWIGGTTHA